MKKIAWLIIVFIFIFSSHMASEKWNQSEFTKEMKQYSNEIFPELSDDHWISDILKRRY